MISHEYFENSLDPFEEKYHCKFSEKKHSLKGLYNESIYTKIDIEDYKVYLENYVGRKLNREYRRKSSQI